MDERTLRLRVGVVVLAAILVTGILVMLMGDMPLPGRSSKVIYVLFPEAPGVSVGTPVRKSGITIGRVSRVELMKPTGVRITTDIDPQFTLLDSEYCRVNNASLLGDALLEFVPGLDSRNAKPLEHGAEIQNGVVAGNPISAFSNLEPDIRAVLAQMNEAAKQFQITAQTLNNVVANNDDQVPRIMQKSEQALDQFNMTMKSMNDLLGDPELRVGLKKTLRDVPALFAEARSTLQQANESFAGMKVVTDRASKNLENLENFTRPLGERGEALVNNLDGSLANVNALLEQLVEFTDNLNSKQGTLGRLMNDEELYQKLNRSLTNIEEITFSVKPILADFKVVSDKLARDPRQLGLKGALDGRPLGVGAKQVGYGGESFIHGNGYEYNEDVYCPPSQVNQSRAAMPILKR
ncbi:MlaD family protein [Anatilimnocola floriformis]|uniref:MlaD family protein n=1 Tax=Anatilimnocola floriformis TaxID=2948575 RepID=UPI0020C50622|nr:MlaD family protein [Anatilimnocola floriformis]